MLPSFGPFVLFEWEVNNTVFKGNFMDALSTISLLLGVIGTAISIYQYALIHESKKRGKELQYLLAAINSSAQSCPEMRV